MTRTRESYENLILFHNILLKDEHRKEFEDIKNSVKFFSIKNISLEDNYLSGGSIKLAIQTRMFTFLIHIIHENNLPATEIESFKLRDLVMTNDIIYYTSKCIPEGCWYEFKDRLGRDLFSKLLNDIDAVRITDEGLMNIDKWLYDFEGMVEKRMIQIIESKEYLKQPETLDFNEVINNSRNTKKRE